MLESEKLVRQAAHTANEQFAASPDLPRGILDAVISGLEAHTAMSTQALNFEAVRAGTIDILLNYANLWERLREKARMGV